MAELCHAIARLLQYDHLGCLWFEDISDNAVSQEGRVLTQRHVLDFPNVAYIGVVDGLAAT